MTRLRYLALVAVVLSIVYAASALFAVIPRMPDVNIRSDSQKREGSVIHYKGHVEMVIDSIAVHADELDFNTDKEKADVRGNVSVQVLPMKPKVIPTVQPGPKP